MRRTTREVVVIGGGFSGLLAAYLLETCLGDAVRVVVIEASGRLGGRIHTRTIGPQRIPYEAGAAEFYDIVGAPQLRQLIAHLGLRTCPLEATPTFFWEGERLDTAADFQRCFGDEGVTRLDDFWRRGIELRPPSQYAEPSFPSRHPWGRMTFAEVLATIRHDAVERFVRSQINSDLAAPPENANGVLGFDNLLVDHPSYCRMFTIDGGNDRLIERLAAKSKATKVLGTGLRGAPALDASTSSSPTVAISRATGSSSASCLTLSRRSRGIPRSSVRPSSSTAGGPRLTRPSCA